MEFVVLVPVGRVTGGVCGVEFDPRANEDRRGSDFVYPGRVRVF